MARPISSQQCSQGQAPGNVPSHCKYPANCITTGYRGSPCPYFSISSSFSVTPAHTPVKYMSFSKHTLYPHNLCSVESRYTKVDYSSASIIWGRPLRKLDRNSITVLKAVSGSHRAPCIQEMERPLAVLIDEVPCHEPHPVLLVMQTVCIPINDEIVVPVLMQLKVKLHVRDHSIADHPPQKFGVLHIPAPARKWPPIVNGRFPSHFPRFQLQRDTMQTKRKPNFASKQPHNADESLIDSLQRWMTPTLTNAKNSHCNTFASVSCRAIAV